MRGLVPLLVIALSFGCANRNTAPSIHSGVSSVEKEIGSAIYEEIIRLLPLYDEPAVLQYVNLVGSRIAAHAERTDIEYQFILIQDDRIYATSAPGGFVYLTTGVFSLVENEGEMAAVLAHEIGALQYRDPRLSELRKAAQTFLQVCSMISPFFGGIGALAAVGMGTMSVSLTRVRSADAQLLQADEKAVKYLARAGYNPDELFKVLKRASERDSWRRPYLYDYLQSHPISGERLKKLEDKFHSLKASAGNAMSDEKFLYCKTLVLQSGGRR